MSKLPKNPGLDDRSRDNNGEIRQKRGDTRIDTLRETYGDDFAKGRRGDMQLETLREETGKSLTDLIKGK
jgi:hypothetical protein